MVQTISPEQSIENVKAVYILRGLKSIIKSRELMSLLESWPQCPRSIQPALGFPSLDKFGGLCSQVSLFLPQLCHHHS